MLVASLQLNTGMILCRYVDIEPLIWIPKSGRTWNPECFFFFLFFLYIHITTLQQEAQLSNMAAACTIAQLTDYSATCGACDLGRQIRNTIGITMGTHILQKARSHPKTVDARREAWRKFHTGRQQLLGATEQHSVDWAIQCPRFVHSGYNHLLYVLSVFAFKLSTRPSINSQGFGNMMVVCQWRHSVIHLELEFQYSAV